LHKHRNARREYINNKRNGPINPEPSKPKTTGIAATPSARVSRKGKEKESGIATKKDSRENRRNRKNDS